MAGLLAGLLGGVPGQLVPQFVADTACFLVEQLKWLGQQRRYGRIDVQLLASLNGLLLSYGEELRPTIATLHRPLQQYVKQAWGERNVRFKEALLCYCRLAVTLGGLQPKAQAELLALINRDIGADGLVWDLQGSKLQQQLAALAATLYYHQAFTAAAGAAGGSSSNAHLTSLSAGSGGGVQGSSGIAVWWRCWCQLADGAAEALTQAIASLLPDDEDADMQDQQHPWAAAAAAAAAAACWGANQGLSG
ncbi:hypothetical protein OEZ86_004752 [Tetradesmus obliquus]|nr:hypothetical protein OEZ86_004752 [Tetradesmus obliquus]